MTQQCVYQEERSVVSFYLVVIIRNMPEEKSVLSSF